MAISDRITLDLRQSQENARQLSFSVLTANAHKYYPHFLSFIEQCDNCKDEYLARIQLTQNFFKEQIDYTENASISLFNLDTLISSSKPLATQSFYASSTSVSQALVAYLLFDELTAKNHAIFTLGVITDAQFRGKKLVANSQLMKMLNTTPEQLHIPNNLIEMFQQSSSNEAIYSYFGINYNQIAVYRKALDFKRKVRFALTKQEMIMLSKMDIDISTPSKIIALSQQTNIPISAIFKWINNPP